MYCMCCVHRTDDMCTTLASIAGKDIVLYLSDLWQASLTVNELIGSYGASLGLCFRQSLSLPKNALPMKLSQHSVCAAHA